MDQERQRIVLDQMSEGLIMATLDGDVRSWNRASLEMHGFASVEEARRSLPDFQHVFALSLPDGTPIGMDQWPMPRILRGEPVKDLLLRLRRIGESHDRLFSYNGGICTSSTGEELVFITITDHTHHEAALNALRNSEERLRSAAEAAGIGTWDVDFVHRRTRYSSELARMLGFAGELYMPLGMRDMFFPDDREMVNAAFARACDPSGDGSMVLEARIRRVDGSLLWVRSSGRVTFGPGPEGLQPVSMVGACVDVTEIRQAERRLATQNAVSMVLAQAATLSEATPRLLQAMCESEGWAFGGIWEVDQSAKVLRCAEMWHAPDAPLQAIASQTRTLSFTRGQGLPGRVWASGRPTVIADVEVDPDYLRAGVVLAAGLRSALAFPITVRGEVIAVLDFIGRSIPDVDPKLLDLFAAIGAQLGLFFERKRAEVERRTLETQLRQAQRIEAIGQLSGGIAHDFNNILAAIVGNVQLALMDVPEDHPVVDCLEQIAQASSRANARSSAR